MPTYFYLVVHIATGKLGRGNSVAQALEQALGHKGHMAFVATTPRIGFFWGKYEPRTLGTTAGARRTVIDRKKMYEVCPVYMNDPRGSAKDKSLLMAVYRSENANVLLKLPDEAHTKTTAVPNDTKRNRKGK